jgi:hypothetical protein
MIYIIYIFLMYYNLIMFYTFGDLKRKFLLNKNLIK